MAMSSVNKLAVTVRWGVICDHTRVRPALERQSGSTATAGRPRIAPRSTLGPSRRWSLPKPLLPGAPDTVQAVHERRVDMDRTQEGRQLV